MEFAKNSGNYFFSPPDTHGVGFALYEILGVNLVVLHLLFQGLGHVLGILQDHNVHHLVFKRGLVFNCFTHAAVCILWICLVSLSLN